jgi:hypothetical protein
MTLFDKRDDAFEAKFARDAEMLFKARARRNKLIGLWAAGLAGKTGEEAEKYGQEVVAADVERRGDADVYAKILGDLIAAGHEVTKEEVGRQLAYWQDVARDQIAKGV